jgi:hypothetical protein
MALKGNLRDFTITQLLNLINLARKTGALVVEGAAGEAVWVYFREGKLAYATQTGQDDSLATVLYHAKKLNANSYKVIKERSAQMNDKELGLLLINANYLSQQDILASLQGHYSGVVSQVFTWEEGIFRFENDQLPPDAKISLRMNLENLIIEGARRTKELEQLQDEIPSLDISLKFADRPGSNIRNVNLSEREWKVVKFINPKNTLRQIAQTTRFNDLDIRKVAYSLLQAGLVEFVRAPAAAGYARPATVPAMPVVNKDEQKSLINRIITRIRSL